MRLCLSRRDGHFSALTLRSSGLLRSRLPCTLWGRDTLRTNHMSERATCLCGSIKISADLSRHKFTACHCTMCRKWGGLWLAVECDDVSFSGEGKVTTYHSSEMADRGFCADCGTHLFFKSKWNGKYYMPVGLFDEVNDFVLHRQIFYDTKPYYLCLANESEKYTEADLNKKHGIK